MPVKPMLLLQKEEQDLAVGSSLCRASADGEGTQDDEENELARGTASGEASYFLCVCDKRLTAAT